MQDTLQSILLHSYNPDPGLRAQAEAALNSFLQAPGAFLTVIHLMRRQDVHRDLRMAAGIFAKNKTRDLIAEDSTTKKPFISAEEREQVKAEIIDALLPESDASLRAIIVEIIRIFSEHDYPDNWPNLIPIFLNNIQSQNIAYMYNSLYALRKIIKRFEFKSIGPDREPLNNLISIIFPYLQVLISQLVENNSIEAALVLKICFKIFHSSTCYALPKVQGIDVNLWFNILAKILDKKLPEASEGIEPFNQPISIEDRKNWAWWKLKKWTARIISMFIQRYGNPKYTGEENRPFATFFRDNTAKVLLGPVMNTLAVKAEGAFITDDVFRLSLQYVSNAIELSPTYRLIKPHMDFILFRVIFPSLCLTVEDIKLFEDDPIEFIRKINDPSEEWLDPRIAAINLLQSLGRYRLKDTLPLFLPFRDNLLVEYNSSPVEARDYRKKDGVLVAIATLFKESLFLFIYLFIYFLFIYLLYLFIMYPMWFIFSIFFFRFYPPT